MTNREAYEEMMSAAAELEQVKAKKRVLEDLCREQARELKRLRTLNKVKDDACKSYKAIIENLERDKYLLELAVSHYQLMGF